MAYHRYSGSWAYILHRISGIGLTAYLFVHIWALSSLSKGRGEFQHEMDIFTTTPFKIVEWLLGLLVMFHAFNGIRIALVDLGEGAKHHKKLLAAVWVSGVAVVVFMFVLIFQEELFGKAIF